MNRLLVVKGYIVDSALRKISILAKLSRYKKTTARDIQKQLDNEGEQVTLRTIQRDLVELASKFPILGDESKPINWSLEKQAELIIPNFDLTTSVMFVLADKHLKDLLPPSMLSRLAPFVVTAKIFLDNVQNNSASQWPKKVALHPKGLPLQPTDFDEDIINAIYGSVLREKCLRIQYNSLISGNVDNYTIHPHGVVVRGERSYLIASYDGYDDLRQLSFSRITGAEELERKAIINNDFSLSNFVNTGEMGVLRDQDKLEIKLWITPVLATILQETPLCSDQVVSPHNDDFFVTATVDNSDELRHWILSMCNHITVIEPIELRKEIKESLYDSLSYYE